MKFLLILCVINLKTIDQFPVENLLGKDLEEVKKALKTDFTILNNNLGDMYFSEFKNVRSFYGKTYKKISLHLNESGKVKFIMFHFEDYLDNNFFYSFISNYGSPSKILGIKSQKKISEELTCIGEDAGKRRITQRKLEMQEVTLQDNPLFIYWFKKNYLIKIVNNKGYLSSSDLVFSLPNETF